MRTHLRKFENFFLGRIFGAHFNLITENFIVKYHIGFITVIWITVQLFFYGYITSYKLDFPIVV